MTYDNKERLEELGFKTPIAPIRKDDPRGPEYGYFEVTELDSGRLQLRKRGDFHTREWMCVFPGIQTLEYWARDCT